MIIKTNKSMDSALTKIDYEDIKLSKGLQNLLKSGFLFQEKCAFLRELKSSNEHLNLDSFYDRISYECTVNSIHISDYVSTQENYLGYGIAYANQLTYEWTKEKKKECLIVLVTVDSQDVEEHSDIVDSQDEDVMVRFYLDRGPNGWLDDNLNQYEHPVLSISSSSFDRDWHHSLFQRNYSFDETQKPTPNTS